MSARLLKWCRGLAGIAITCVFLYLSLSNIRIRSVLVLLARIPWPTLVAALGMLAADYAARGFRWWWMLRAFDPVVRWRSCIWPLLASVAVNNVVPLRVGDALRVVSFTDQLRSSTGRLLGALLVERMLDLTVLLVLLLLGIGRLGPTAYQMYHSKLALTAVSLGLAGWLLLVIAADPAERLCLWVLKRPLLASRNWVASARAHVQQAFLVPRH